MSSFQEIPRVDLGALHGAAPAREALAEELAEICHQVGFFIIENHGIQPRLIDSVFSQSKRFFDLPPEQKRLIDKRHSRHFRGWEDVGAELTNGRPDMREQIDLWSEHPARDKQIEPAYLRLLGPNQWLDDALLPGFRTTLNRWFVELGQLADDLLGVLASGLGLPEDCFRERFGNQQMSLTKLICYPPTPAGQFGVNAHHDTGFLTLLAADETPGLQVENADGQWLDVPNIPGGLVVNLGEMLQAMTSNYFVATPHRVVTRESRLSLAYFHGPSLYSSLDPVELSSDRLQRVAASPRHAAAGFMARREETAAGVGDMQSSYRAGVYGEQLWNYFCRSYPDNVAAHYAKTTIA